MNIELQKHEQALVDLICREKVLSQTALIRQALKIYQIIDAKSDDAVHNLLQDHALNLSQVGHVLNMT